MRKRFLPAVFLIAALLLSTSGFSLFRLAAALPLPDGRSYDQTHDAGLMDWSGPVQYVLLNHRDDTTLPPQEGGAACNAGSGCQEWVTRIANGGIVSGGFAGEVSYFEVMVAFSHDPGAGSFVLQACSESQAASVYLGLGGSLPGFITISMTVPAGCRTWSLSAAGGYVDFRSVDANYTTLFPTITPIWTSTRTRTPVRTTTPLPTSTSTLTKTRTSTATLTLTLTSTKTSTVKPSPTFTLTRTRTSTSTLLPTLTSTRTQTVTPTVTQTVTPTVTQTLSPTATATETPSLTLTSTQTATSTAAATATWTQTLSPTTTITPTTTPYPTNTMSHTPTLTATISSTLTPSPTLTFPSTPLLPVITSANILCDRWGEDGWCVENARLSIVASDPQGFPLTITGKAEQLFSCDSSCVVALPEGAKTAIFTVSSTSGRTASGSMSWKYDVSPPTSAVRINGTAGANGWYVSAVTVSGIGIDTVSGMATLEVSVNGGAWQPSATLSDGIYQVQSRSVDNAGWETLSAVQTVRVDTLKPGLDMVPNQTKGGKDYFHQAVTVSIKGTDGGSGVALLEYCLDGENWVRANSLTISTDGGHGLEVRVTDNASNVTWKVMPVYMDTIPPVANFVLPVPNSTTIESGTVLVGGNVSDIGSGVERVELSFDGGKTWLIVPLVNEIWNYNWDTLNIPNGRYPVIARAWDVAGNVQSAGASITLVVDNQAPEKATRTIPAFTNIPLTATPTSASTPSPTRTMTATSTRHIQPTETMTETPTPTSKNTPVPVLPPTGKHLSLWPIVGLIGLLLALASASLTDHRPQALRRIGQTFNQIIAQKKLGDGE